MYAFRHRSGGRLCRRSREWLTRTTTLLAFFNRADVRRRVYTVASSNVNVIFTHTGAILPGRRNRPRHRAAKAWGQRTRLE
jgi:hypothetical protein